MEEADTCLGGLIPLDRGDYHMYPAVRRDPVTRVRGRPTWPHQCHCSCFPRRNLRLIPPTWTHSGIPFVSVVLLILSHFKKVLKPSAHTWLTLYHQLKLASQIWFHQH